MFVAIFLAVFGGVFDFDEPVVPVRPKPAVRVVSEPPATRVDNGLAYACGEGRLRMFDKR